MKKQLIYSKIIPRLFATSLDLFLLAYILQPVTNFINRNAIVYAFKEFFMRKGIDITSDNSLNVLFENPQLAQDIPIDKFLIYYGIILGINFLLMGIYFIGSWTMLGATVGKFLLRIRVADFQTFEKPSIYQSTRRFLALPSGFLGIAMAIFSAQKQAWHDKVAGTIVIKF